LKIAVQNILAPLVPAGTAQRKYSAMFFGLYVA